MTPEKAFKVLAALVEASTPKPISEAPKDGNELLTCNTRQGCMKGLMCWSQICERWESKGEPIYVQPTHYLPLPDFSTEHAAELAAAIEALRAAIGGSEVNSESADSRRDLNICELSSPEGRNGPGYYVIEQIRRGEYDQVAGPFATAEEAEEAIGGEA